MIYIILFILGLCFGSFLNVLIYRTTHEGSPWKGRSYCPKCKKKIFWYDNIPLLSYILLRGRCRSCGKEISPSYPLVEFLTAIQFVWVGFIIQKNLAFLGQFEGFYSFFYLVYLIFIFYILLGITIADFKHYLVPDSLVIPGIVVSALFVLTSYNFIYGDYKSYFLSGLGAAGFFASLILITRGKGLGWGDVKLGLLMGLFLGWPKILVAVYLAFLTGSLVGVILILAGKKKFGQTIPFAPFLVWGTLLAFFWGKELFLVGARLLGF